MSLTLRDDGEFYDDEEDFDDESDEEWYSEDEGDERVCEVCGDTFEDCDCETDNEEDWS